MDERACPCGNGIMELADREECVEMRGEQLTVTCRSYLCPCCGIESGCVEDADEAQMRIAEAYRKKMGLITGEALRLWREKMGLSYKDVAARLEISEAYAEDLEEVAVQSEALDEAMRRRVADA